MQDPPTIRIRNPDGVLHIPAPAAAGETGPSINLSENDAASRDPFKEWQTLRLPVVETIASPGGESFRSTMNDLLRATAVSYTEKKNFWPPILFERLFHRSTVERIVEELLSDNSLGKPSSGAMCSDLKTYWTDTICNPGGKQYRRILAMLILAEKPHRIKAFVESGLSDENLPLSKVPDEWISKGIWRPFDTDLVIGVYQYGFKVQVLRPAEDGSVPHYQIKGGEIKPWLVLETGSKKPSTAYSDAQIRQYSRTMSPAEIDQLSGGGFGEVKKIMIHPWQHGFGDLPHTVSLVCHTVSPWCTLLAASCFSLFYFRNLLPRMYLLSSACAFEATRRRTLRRRRRCSGDSAARGTIS